MTTEQLLTALRGWGNMVSTLAPPLGQTMVAAIAIAEDAVKAAAAMQQLTAVDILNNLRLQLRQSISDEWQAKIDSQFPQTD